MNQVKFLSDHPSRDNSDVRYRRLLFQSWRRGTQESDLILGSFAAIRLRGFDNAQLDRFEALLDCTDPELFDWMIGGIAPPPQHNHDVLRLLRDFCARPGRTPRRDETDT